MKWGVGKCNFPAIQSNLFDQYVRQINLSLAKKEVQGDMSYAIIRNDKLTRVDAQGS